MKQHNMRAYLSYGNVNMNKNKTKQSWMRKPRMRDMRSRQTLFQASCTWFILVMLN